MRVVEGWGALGAIPRTAHPRLGSKLGGMGWRPSIAAQRARLRSLRRASRPGDGLGGSASDTVQMPAPRETRRLATSSPGLNKAWGAGRHGLLGTAGATEMILVATSPAVHPLFDLAAWAAGAASGWAIWRWRLKGAALSLAARAGPGYFVALAAGAVTGDWLAGSLKTLRGPDPSLSHSIAGAMAGAIV